MRSITLMMLRFTSTTTAATKMDAATVITALTTMILSLANSIIMTSTDGILATKGDVGTTEKTCGDPRRVMVEKRLRDGVWRGF